jgi:signal peptidase I
VVAQTGQQIESYFPEELNTMFSIFTPRYIKQGRNLAKHARKLLAYKRDILREGALAELEGSVVALDESLRARDRQAVEQSAEKLDAVFSKHIPQRPNDGWRENVEVLVVAIVLAIGVRSYFLQPFTIPTGSMQPTLNGIVGHPADTPPPSLPVRVWEAVVRGRSYVNTVCERDETVTNMVEKHWLRFFVFTDVQTTSGSHTIHAPRETLQRFFQVKPGREYKAGEAIARGCVDPGDMVFVDKLSYNFRAPHAGEVFVFKTTGIRYIEQSLRMQGIEGSQFYIKRLAGTPGDELNVQPPLLYRNGSVARERGFARVMTGTYDNPHDGYRGYGNGPEFLTNPDSKYRLPEHRYFAMGDNSYNSSDSRYWGTVPEKNITGHGLFVYWPFLPHWGLIR